MKNVSGLSSLPEDESAEVHQAQVTELALLLHTKRKNTLWWTSFSLKKMRQDFAGVVRLPTQVLWIQIRMDPHHFGNPDPHSHQIKIRIRIHIKVISWIRIRNRIRTRINLLMTSQNVWPNFYHF